jgi:hypothetical protein
MFYVWNEFGLELMECSWYGWWCGFNVRYILRLSLILLDLCSKIEAPMKQVL